MPRKECAQCVEHARLHSGNWLGFGPANDPCPPCEDHAENGCPGNQPQARQVAATTERNPMAFGRKAAEKLDSAAAVLHKVGGKSGDAVANTILAPARSRINESCTNCDKGKCKTH
jgi:hypothetical protein